MQLPWFKFQKKGFPLEPVRWQGWTILAWGAIMLLLSIYVAAATSASASDTLINAFPFMFGTLILTFSIAYLTSDQHTK